VPQRFQQRHRIVKRRLAFRIHVLAEERAIGERDSETAGLSCHLVEERPSRWCDAVRLAGFGSGDRVQHRRTVAH
jgi:hypothetical protein